MEDRLDQSQALEPKVQIDYAYRAHGFAQRRLREESWFVVFAYSNRRKEALSVVGEI